MATTRREFLRHTAGAALLATSPALPGFLARTARAATPERERSVLVVVQLSGGNDGLNTVVPYRDDAYYRLRPTLAVPPDDVLRLDDGLGLHPEMVALKELYDDGLLGVINNVGYPRPDRSHFRSMDIWHTAVTEPEDVACGWLGRAADRKPASDVPYLMQVDDAALPLALKSERTLVPSIDRLETFADRPEEAVEAAVRAPRADASDDLQFVQRVSLNACRQAARIREVASAESPGVDYPGFRLAARLRQIARLIAADFGPRVYYTSLGGFDTHSQQVLTHPRLLRELAGSVGAFFADLRARGVLDRVLLMTFSEFGRRVAENGSRGTDHGAAAPMLLAGVGVQAGLHGGVPELAALEAGDVPYRVDFRSVYADVLGGWLGVPAGEVLSGVTARAGVLRRGGSASH